MHIQLLLARESWGKWGKKEEGGVYKQLYHLNIALGSITIPRKKKKRQAQYKKKNITGKKNKLDFYLARCHICLTHDGVLLI